MIGVTDATKCPSEAVQGCVGASRCSCSEIGGGGGGGSNPQARIPLYDQARLNSIGVGALRVTGRRERAQDTRLS